ncbi:hypothetical protein PLCT2_01035 [Planctomycetaceae bacterium]|nr:hypothetical protein PLCT2_01035 [Planctomycetaceae bacterium]
MGHQNRKATKEEMAHARAVIEEAYPDLVAVFGGKAYGGTMAPRVRTISFRLRDNRGKFHTNVIWLQPEWLDSLTVADVMNLVKRSNGKKGK